MVVWGGVGCWVWGLGSVCVGVSVCAYVDVDVCVYDFREKLVCRGLSRRDLRVRF